MIPGVRNGGEAKKVQEGQEKPRERSDQEPPYDDGGDWPDLKRNHGTHGDWGLGRGPRVHSAVGPGVYSRSMSMTMANATFTFLGAAASHRKQPLIRANETPLLTVLE